MRSTPQTAPAAFPNPWRSLMGAAATGSSIGLSLALAGLLLPGSNLGLLVPGIVASVAMGGAWVFARSRSALIEPELSLLRRGEFVAQWEMEPQQWADFARGRRARARAWVFGGAAGLSVLPALLLAVLAASPVDAGPLSAWVTRGLAGLWALGLTGAVLISRSRRVPSPVLFTAKLCAVGGSIYAWPHGIASIELDEESGQVFITRKSGPWMPARTFAIPVGPDSFEIARGLLPARG